MAGPAGGPAFGQGGSLARSGRRQQDRFGRHAGAAGQDAQAGQQRPDGPAFEAAGGAPDGDEDEDDLFGTPEEDEEDLFGRPDDDDDLFGDEDGEEEAGEPVDIMSALQASIDRAQSDREPMKKARGAKKKDTKKKATGS